MAIVANIQPIESYKVPVQSTVKTLQRDFSTNKFTNSHFDPSSCTQWTAFKKDSPIKMTQGLISELSSVQQTIRQETINALEAGDEIRVRYHVLASENPKVFNLGGDLDYLLSLIRERDINSLKRFSLACINLIYNNAVAFNLPITTISLVQGTALGGGFEAALSSNILVVEKQCKMSLPEVMFNMFPGMGAYHLLSRRVSPAVAEKIVLSGKTYCAEEMYEMGVVDILADPGKGEDAVWQYIKRHQNQSHAEWRFRQMVNETSPTLKYEQLERSVEHWVDSALSLDESDLKHMEFLVRVQRRAKF